MTKNRSTPIYVKYVPHGMNSEVYKPIDSQDPQLLDFKKTLFGNSKFDFVVFFNSRNIRRKQIADTMLAYRLFIDMLPIEEAKKCAFLLHTQIVDDNGTDLEATREYLLNGEQYNILFSDQRLDSSVVNLLYNSTDVQILLSDNEGWGLSLTEAMLVGNPIIANVQGGMQDQMRFVDEDQNWIDFSQDFPTNVRGTYKECGEWAFPVFPSNISLQGSPQTPYISSDRCRPEDAAERLFEVYKLGHDERKRRGALGRQFALEQFTTEKQADRVIEAIDTLFENWKPRNKFEFINVNEQKPKTIPHPLIF